MIVMVIQTSFTDRDHLWMSREPSHQIEMPVFRLRCIVGMDAYTGINPIVGFRDGNSATHVVRAGSSPDGHNSSHTRIPGALDDTGAVRSETSVIQMSV